MTYILRNIKKWINKIGSNKNNWDNKFLSFNYFETYYTYNIINPSNIFQNIELFKELFFKNNFIFLLP